MNAGVSLVGLVDGLVEAAQEDAFDVETSARGAIVDRLAQILDEVVAAVETLDAYGASQRSRDYTATRQHLRTVIGLVGDVPRASTAAPCTVCENDRLPGSRFCGSHQPIAPAVTP